MTNILKLLSVIGLCLTILPAFGVWYEVIPWRLHVQLMFAGMLLWFSTAPFWMNVEKDKG